MRLFTRQSWRVNRSCTGLSIGMPQVKCGVTTVFTCVSSTDCLPLFCFLYHSRLISTIRTGSIPPPTFHGQEVPARRAPTLPKLRTDKDPTGFVLDQMKHDP